jgi:hypothetical protein
MRRDFNLKPPTLLEQDFRYKAALVEEQQKLGREVNSLRKRHKQLNSKYTVPKS